MFIKTAINNAKRFYTCNVSTASFQYDVTDSLRHIKIINIVGFLILLIKSPSEKLIIENHKNINNRLDYINKRLDFIEQEIKKKYK
mgnify:CR=1 FL=1